MGGAEKKAWIVTVSMGYGHRRAAIPLLDMAPGGEAIVANSYEGMPDADRKIWNQSESFYYFISRLKSKGPLGRLAFNIFDRYQKIDEYYPLRPLRGQEAPSVQLKKIYSQIKRGWGRHLIEKLSEDPLPLVTPFFTVAHMAEHWKYPGKIYTLVTDSDASRAWAPYSPKKSPVFYLAPTARVVDRLRSYGVREEKIFLTGFPLPHELVGSRSTVAKKNLLRRLSVLDPSGRHMAHYAPILRPNDGELHNKKSVPPRIAFVIGGAGAQAEIGASAVKSLAPLLKKRELHFHFIPGVSRKAAEVFRKAVGDLRLDRYVDKTIHILFSEAKDEYFARFNALLPDIDVLWTKPSELSFYAALGLPILMAPPVGSQEIQNRRWLLEIGAGIDQLSPAYAGEWLPDYISHGRFSELAMRGFIEIERDGADNIRKAVLGDK